jgi:HEAT repeat protein
MADATREALDALVEGLGCRLPDSEAVRTACADALVQAGPKAEPALLEALDSPDLRLPVLRLVGRRSQAGSRPSATLRKAVEGLTRDPVPEVRAAALDALGEAGGGSERLLDPDTEPSPLVRASAARALAGGRSGSATAVRALSGALREDPTAEVRRAAAVALGILVTRPSPEASGKAAPTPRRRNRKH